MTPQPAAQVLTLERGEPEQDEQEATLAIARDGARAALAEVELESTEQCAAVVAVLGMGYVGLPTAIALRGAGAHIIGIDVSAERLARIRAGGAELLPAEQDEL